MKTPESLLQTDGVLAVVTFTSIPLPELKFPNLIGSAGDGHLISIASHALELFEHTNEDTLRVVIGDKTISAARSTRVSDDGDGFDVVAIAVVITTGHPAVKSVRRTMRKVIESVRRKPERESAPVPSSSVPSKSWF